MHRKLGRGGFYALGLLVALASVSKPLSATLSCAVAAPEIDGSVMTTAAGLLAGAVLILRARRTK